MHAQACTHTHTHTHTHPHAHTHARTHTHTNTHTCGRPKGSDLCLIADFDLKGCKITILLFLSVSSTQTDRQTRQMHTAVSWVELTSYSYSYNILAAIDLGDLLRIGPNARCKS